VPPTAALRGADLVEARRRPTGRRLGLPALLLALGAWLATLGPVHGFPLFGYAAAVAIVFGASFLVPIVLTLVIRAVERPVRSRLRVEDWLAVRNLAAAVPRISISVAALAVSLSMMVAIAVMIGSFRETVIYWVAQTLQADLFVGPGTRRRTGGDESLSAEVTAGVSASPDVAAVDRFRVREIPYGDSRIRLGCGEFDVLLAHATLLFKEPRDARDAMRQAIGQDAVVVSESFALKYRVRPGDRVPLPTPDGMARFRVAAVYYDYSNDRGVVMMDRATYARYYRDVAPSGLSVYLKAGVDPERARERLLAVLGDRHRVSITTNAAVRTEALRVFDSTFAITYALELVAILVAILGVAGSLLTRVLERAPELALLGLLGLDRRRMRRMVLGEAAVIGAVSQAVGLLIGLALSLVLIYVINVQSFGWTIQFHLPVAFLVQSSLATIAATTLAGLYPARRAIGLTPRQDE
jgi:putative ABC transport system permease protein